MMRRVLMSVVLLGIVGVVVVSLGYRWFDRKAYDAVVGSGMPASMANGVKHAYTAGELYAVMRSVGVGHGFSQETVLWLGELNEYAEKLVKRPRDTTAEVGKDLHNNFVGIEAARWHLAHGKKTVFEDRLAVVLALAQTHVVAAVPEQVSSGYSVIAKPSRVPDVGKAIMWFEDNRDVIAVRVDAALEGLAP